MFENVPDLAKGEKIQKKNSTNLSFLIFFSFWLGDQSKIAVKKMGKKNYKSWPLCFLYLIKIG